ncbi:MAG TPA: YigZ family protein [Puia sp.]|nr:YigZ family protein [Puia sp.]
MTVQEDYYYTIDREANADFRDRGSRFIAYASPLKNKEDFRKRLADAKKEHPKATHLCFAYRLGLDGSQFRVSDDGEPSGSAGRPILGQIDSKKLTDVLVIVVRYFGGTLLGVPGLIHAYRSAAALSLQLVPVLQKPVEVSYTIVFDYTRVNEVMTILKKNQCSVTDREMQLFCRLQIGIPRNRLEEVLFSLQGLPNLEMLKT